MRCKAIKHYLLKKKKMKKLQLRTLEKGGSRKVKKKKNYS